MIVVTQAKNETGSIELIEKKQQEKGKEHIQHHPHDWTIVRPGQAATSELLESIGCSLRERFRVRRIITLWESEPDSMIP